ncbi:TetR/AcrR family transcriptional regulator [uncultured Croceitalea sp.]|uniref:TetR/AcrR family transcriptional regulator n=1 Tax=uncultured Croceitalea sp. TaxID=1798908 RepID=UPI0033068B8C
MRVKEDAKLTNIYQATINLTSKVGISGLKMSLIAKEAHIATGTIYLYFKNKNELLNAVYAHLKSEGLGTLMGKIDHLPIHAQLYRLWEIAFEYYVSNHAKSIFMEQFEVSSIISTENKELEEDTIVFLNTTLDKAKAQGIIKNINNHLIVSLILGFLKDLSFKATTAVIESNEEIKHISYSMCWDAICKNINE